MKTCLKCNINKPLDDYSKRINSRDGYRNTCKLCKCEITAKWRANNLERHKQYFIDNKEEIKERRAKRGYENQRKVLNYLLENPCIKCGEDNPLFLDFDHIDPKTKTAPVSARKVGWNWKRIQKEIDKCQILCMKCHRLKTALQQNWYNWLTKEERQKFGLDSLTLDGILIVD